MSTNNVPYRRARRRRRNRWGDEHTVTLDQYRANPMNKVPRHGGTRAWRRARAKGTFGIEAIRDGRR